MSTRPPFGLRTAAFVAVLVVAELGLHHAGDYGKWVVQDNDARLGWRMLPDQAGWSRDYDVREYINARGYRDREWASPETARAEQDVLRVAVVGNSITYGSGVPVEEVWPRVVERLLTAELARRGDPGRAVVQNFAVQGYVFEQMARVFEDQIAAYEPDLLVVPNLAPDIRPMPPAFDSPPYRLRGQVIRTALYEMLRERVIDRWIPPPGASTPPSEPAALKREQLTAALPAMHRRFHEVLGVEVPEYLPLDPADRSEPDPELPSHARLWGRLERELWRAVLPVPPGQVPQAIWDVLSAEPVRLAGAQADADLTLVLFGAFESALLEPFWKLLDAPVMNTPWTPSHRVWWYKLAARLEGIQRRMDEWDGKLAIVTVTRLHEVLDENLPEDRQTVKPVDLFWQTWLPGQAERRASGRLFYTFTRPEFALLQPDVTQALIEFGYVEGPRGTKRIDPRTPGVGQSLFLLNDVGHFSARGHAAFAELVVRSWIDQGLFGR